MFIITSRTE